MSNTPGCYEAFKKGKKKKKIPVQVLHFLGNAEAVGALCSTRIPTLKRSFLRIGLDSQTPSNSPTNKQKASLDWDGRGLGGGGRPGRG